MKSYNLQLSFLRNLENKFGSIMQTIPELRNSYAITKSTRIMLSRNLESLL